MPGTHYTTPVQAEVAHRTALLAAVRHACALQAARTLRLRSSPPNAGCAPSPGVVPETSELLTLLVLNLEQSEHEDDVRWPEVAAWWATKRMLDAGLFNVRIAGTFGPVLGGPSPASLQQTPRTTALAQEDLMHASVSDRIIVRGLHVGDPGRRGVIREVHGTNGQAPYLVDWSDGHHALFYPAGDATIEPKEEAAPAAEA